MDTLVPLAQFSKAGGYLMATLLIMSLLAGTVSAVNLFRRESVGQRQLAVVFSMIAVIFLAGFALICWFHFQVYRQLPLVLAPELADWLNSQLQAMNRGAAYGLPLYDAASPPRYAIPVWIENEKYYFWFMCYALVGLAAYRRSSLHRFRAVVLILLAVQVGILYWWVNPFSEALPRFFAEVEPWFFAKLPPMQQVGLFMKLYPRQIFYYNAEYMWLHPPMLFIAYAAITLTFITSSFMLVRRDMALETLGYDYAKLGFLMLTLGMLLGYPWALKAWGPNWWWDPKICSSIMMWAVFSTYLHTRLYANKTGMWYFTSILGIVCFLAMIFTFLTSFLFPGEHTFQ